MARLFGDGFDQYGEDETNMLDGIYAQTHSSLSTAQVATGTHSILISGKSGLSAFQGLRKVLPTSTDKMGAMARFYFSSLPTSVSGCCIFSFLTDDPARSQVCCFVDANGALRFYRGNDTVGNTHTADGTLIAQTDPIIVASAWNHVEVQIYIHDTLGWIRVAVNGVHRYQATSLDTKFNSTNIHSVAQYRPFLDDGSPTFYMDDYILYDFEGDPLVDTDFCPSYDGSGVATGYIGELQGMWCTMTADTAEDDWVPSTGSDSYAMVDEVGPDDADYILSTTAADLTEMEIADLPEEITYIRGVDLWGRLSKSDAGAVMITQGMRSNAEVFDAAERPVTVEPTYWIDQCNTDPDSDARWSRAGFNAAWYRLTRTV